MSVAIKMLKSPGSLRENPQICISKRSNGNWCCTFKNSNERIYQILVKYEVFEDGSALSKTFDRENTKSLTDEQLEALKQKFETAATEKSDITYTVTEEKAHAIFKQVLGLTEDAYDKKGYIREEKFPEAPTLKN